MRKGERPGEGVKLRLICRWCGKPFEKYRSQVRRVGGGQYCSRLCSQRGTAPKRSRFGSDHPKWRGGSGSYRERALREYGEQCVVCGYFAYRELLWVHHKDFKKRSEDQDHSLENLEVLCVRCHFEKHIDAERGGRAVQIPSTASLHVSKSPESRPEVGEVDAEKPGSSGA